MIGIAINMQPTTVDNMIITTNATNLSLRFLKVFINGTHIVTIKNHIAPDINFITLLNWNPSFQFASLSSDLANRLHK